MNTLEREYIQATEEVNVVTKLVEENKRAIWTAEAILNNATDKTARATAKKNTVELKLELKRLQDRVKIAQETADAKQRLMMSYQAQASTAEHSVATESNVVRALENLNAYYIASESQWYCIYTNHNRYQPEVKPITNETMKDLILSETGWTETNELTIKKIAQGCNRMFRDVERSFLPSVPTVVNQMNELREKFWLKPICNEQPHIAFDLLFSNLVGGDADYKNQIEKYIAYSYVRPEDIFAPNIDSSARGGVGRDTVFRILEIIFTEACCGEAKRETVQGTHNGELWGKVWVKVSESNSRHMDINELKNLTGGHNYRHREMGRNAVQIPRTFRFFMMSNNFAGTAKLAGSGAGAEDRRWEPVFSNTSLVHRIAEHFGLDYGTSRDPGVGKKSVDDLLETWQRTVYQNETEIARWLGYIIQKHNPAEIKKLTPLHGRYYEQMLDRQKNSFNTFMDTIMDLRGSTNCFAIDDLVKIYRIVSGQTQEKSAFGKRMCEWLINKTNVEWEIRSRDIYADDTDTADQRIRRQVVALKELELHPGRPPSGEDTRLIFDIYDFIEEDRFNDKGERLDRRPHINNIKNELM